MRQTDHYLRMYEVEIVNGYGMRVKKPTIYRKEDTVLPRNVTEKIIESEERKYYELP